MLGAVDAPLHQLDPPPHLPAVLLDEGQLGEGLELKTPSGGENSEIRPQHTKFLAVRISVFVLKSQPSVHYDGSGTPMF